MKSVLSKVIIFAAGAAIGSLVAWKVTENKYEQILQDEIDSVKERYDKIYENRRQFDEIIEEKENENEEEDIPDEYYEEDRKEYRDIVEENDYRTEENENEDGEEEDDSMVEPYVIEPDDFDTVTGYDVEFLTLYADGKLAYDFDNALVEDVDGMIGKDNLSRMGEFEEGLLHVRNEEMMCDFEISYDQDNYEESE